MAEVTPVLLDLIRGNNVGINSKTITDGQMLLNKEAETLSFDAEVDGTVSRITIKDPRVAALITRMEAVETLLEQLQVEGYSLVMVKNPYTYTAVVPVGSENPSEEGWYERIGAMYDLTEDTTVDTTKTYYTRSTAS